MPSVFAMVGIHHSYHHIVSVGKVEHALSCSRGGFLSIKHNEIHDLTAELMSEVCYILFEVWVALFEFCWEYGRVPTLWRESVIVPVPKKQGRGVCDVNTF